MRVRVKGRPSRPHRPLFLRHQGPIKDAVTSSRPLTPTLSPMASAQQVGLVSTLGVQRSELDKCHPGKLDQTNCSSVNFNYSQNKRKVQFTQHLFHSGTPVGGVGAPPPHSSTPLSPNNNKYTANASVQFTNKENLCSPTGGARPPLWEPIKLT